MTALAKRHVAAFSAVALGVYAFAFWLSARLAIVDRPRLLAASLAVDLALTVPVAFWWWVLRPAGRPVVQAAPLCALGLATAWLLFPGEHRASLEWIALPLEALVMGRVLWVVRRELRTDRAGEDPLHVLHGVAASTLGRGRVAEVVGSELAVLRFSLGAWRARPHVPAGATAFPHHRRGNHGAIVAALLCATAGELVATHVLVALWSHVAAWVLTALSAYGGLWLLADWRAAVLRPLLVDARGCTLRAGIRWEVRVRREDVVAIERRRPAGAALSLGFLTQPDTWVCLREPVEAVGPYGLRRRVSAVGVTPDDRAAFLAAFSLDA